MLSQYRFDHLQDVMPLVDFDAEEVIWYARRWGIRKVVLHELAHGAGTQTSVLLALANHAWMLPKNRPGYLPLDMAFFCDVADGGQECEWPETLAYLDGIAYFCDTTPVYRVNPSDWNHTLQRKGSFRGLFEDMEMAQAIPLRTMRWCTDWFKIIPHHNLLHEMHELFARKGVELSIVQYIGYSADEQGRWERSKDKSPFPWLSYRAPLIEWGWNRQDTIAMYEMMLPQMAHVTGLPKKSGCWFCPFQKRGRMQPDGKATDRTWTRLRQEHPELYDKAVTLEGTSNDRRDAEGKRPIYFYNDKPLQYWTAQANQISMFADDAEDCDSGACFM